MAFIGEVGEFVPPMGLKKQKSNIAKRAPYEKPAFTLGQLKKAIPPHCFKRSIVQSLSYVVYDLTFIFTLYYVATNYFPNLPRGTHLLIWPVYFLVQGCVMFRLWLIAHECGHHAISDYQLLDDIVGLILHSSLLVPYFSWKISHRRHHSNIGSLERDEVFVPQTKSNLRWFTKYLSTNPPGRVLTLAITLGLGWPLYLLFNVSGRKYERFVSHYDPYAPLFNRKERMLVYISDICVLLVYFSLYHLALAKGLHWVLCVYGGPLLVMNALVVLTSYLQHTHPALPHYNQSEWDWLRGTLATVDRDYGVLNKFFHNCINAHVVHHLFSTVPHYHVVEATNAIRPILGNYYQSDDTPFYKALWREAKECIYVEPDESNNGVFWYNNKM